MGEGLAMQGEPKEGKISIIAAADGLLKVDSDALFDFNMLGEVSCATLHNNTLVKKGQIIAGTRAIPLVVKKQIVEEAVRIAETAGKVLKVVELKKPKAGIVITGNEVYYGRIKDAFAPVIKSKIEAFDGEIVGIYYAPDDEAHIEQRLRELITAGADLLITTGGMSVDPDDVTRFAIRNIGVSEITYGSPVLPGTMFLVAYLDQPEIDNHKPDAIPIIGIPACGMYSKTTVFDIVLPRVLAGERLGRKELATLGHGGLCMNCEVCRYPVCPFGK
jgi:molybdopterin biosynthesis enzyme